MPAHDTLAARFETHRPHLLAVATRLLGSPAEAEDAVQETWLRFDRTGNDGIDNLVGWLTTVVSRICLDHLRARATRREAPLEPARELIEEDTDPEREAILAESVGLAMQTVLQRLAPAERVAFVLHDVFGVSFEEIAGIVDRSPAAARQLASRARQRVRGASDGSDATDVTQQHAVEAFFQASRTGDLQALLAVLDPEVVLRPDAAALQMGARTGWLTSELRGANAVAEQFKGRAQAARPATIDGTFGAVWAPGGKPRVVFRFTVDNGTITAIDLIADPDTIATLDVVIAGD